MLQHLVARRSRGAPGLGRTVGAIALVTGGLTAAARANEPEKDGREVGLFPLAGGDTDNGFGLGALGSVAMYDKANPMYRWKLAFSGFYATKSFPPSPSYIDGATTLTIPQLLDDHLRLEIRTAFTLDEALPFYGFGDRPTIPDPKIPDRDFYQRLHPAITVNTRWRLSPHWYALGGVKVTYDKITVEPQSTLAMDVAPLDPFLTKPHGVLRFETGLQYDTRDNELSPNCGQYHQLKMRESPALDDVLPYSYRQYNGTARFYFLLVPERLVLALRGVVDLQTGNVPFYEESRFEDTSAIGGSQGVRGVPAYQLYGRAKAFGNVELRYKAWRFAAASRTFVVGFAGFFDAGRVWAQIRDRNAELDGTGLGLHYGIGGGIRLQQGRSFLVRADLAWSPDAKPIGAYLQADHAF